MTTLGKGALALSVSVLCGCGREATPAGPSGTTSFLAGTWRGTVTIQINPGEPNAPPPSTGDMTWTFEVVPQTNMQSLRATIRSSHPWLTMDTTGTTALSPGNSPPTAISTHVISTHRAAVAARSEASATPRRRGSRPISPERIARRCSPAGLL